jgi:chromosome segregation ATPase
MQQLRAKCAGLQRELNAQRQRGGLKEREFKLLQAKYEDVLKENAATQKAAVHTAQQFEELSRRCSELETANAALAQENAVLSTSRHILAHNLQQSECQIINLQTQLQNAQMAFCDTADIHQQQLQALHLDAQEQHSASLVLSVRLYDAVVTSQGLQEDLAGALAALNYLQQQLLRVLPDGAVFEPQQIRDAQFDFVVELVKAFWARAAFSGRAAGNTPCIVAGNALKTGGQGGVYKGEPITNHTTQHRSMEPQLGTTHSCMACHLS